MKIYASNQCLDLWNIENEDEQEEEEEGKKGTKSNRSNHKQMITNIKWTTTFDRLDFAHL